MNNPGYSAEYNRQWRATLKQQEKRLETFGTIEDELNGTWATKWKEAQARPRHLIDVTRAPQGKFCCTCGRLCKSITEWSQHATGENERND